MGRRISEIGSRQTVSDLVETVAVTLASVHNGVHGGVRDGEILREARELVAAYFDQPKHWPLLKANKWVESADWHGAMVAAEKYVRGAPLAYAVGRVNFRSLTLAVDERVLIPRPETELLVDAVLRRKRSGVAVDVGTGSGAIALALAAEGSFDRVIATDISLDAIEVARTNAATAPLVELRHGDLLSAVRETASVIVFNPPYISFDEMKELPASVRDYEPALALCSGRSGMAATARLVRQAASRLEAGGLLALEVDARRASLSAELLAADDRYENISVELDLTGRERFVLATRRMSR